MRIIASWLAFCLLERVEFYKDQIRPVSVTCHGTCSSGSEWKAEEEKEIAVVPAPLCCVLVRACGPNLAAEPAERDEM